VKSTRLLALAALLGAAVPAAAPVQLNGAGATFPNFIGTAVELFLVSRNLERVADLATNIAEDVVFLVEGKSIKHHAEERPDGRTASERPIAIIRLRLRRTTAQHLF